MFFWVFCFVFSIFLASVDDVDTHKTKHTFLFWMLMRLTVWTGSNLFQIGGEPIYVSFLFAYQMIKSLWEIHVRWNFATLQSHLLYLAEAVCCPFGALDNPPPTTWLIHFVFLFSPLWIWFLFCHRWNNCRESETFLLTHFLMVGPF